jgi:hypothetical protein
LEQLVDFTKGERRQLRELAGEVYEAEAHQMLEELESDFKRWREGEILSSELLSAVHEFHQHKSRELWSMYQGLRERETVARGLALGLVAESSVRAELLAKLEPLRMLFRRGNEQ